VFRGHADDGGARRCLDPPRGIGGLAHPCGQRDGLARVLDIPQKYPGGLDEPHFERLFPPVVYNFHGFTAVIKQLLWERPRNERFDLNGYREEGTTTTPFDMLVKNRCSRYHLGIQAGAENRRSQSPTGGAR
jgi:phosphoketolase